MSKFTPGPWDFTKGYRFYHCLSTEKGKTGFYFEVGENAGCGLASHDAEWMANAVLIAAIPDMYHALECALAVLQEECPDEAATEIVRKALEKAGYTPEGENK